MLERETVTSAFPPPTLRPTAKGEADATRALRWAAEAFRKGSGPIPVGSQWREEAVELFGIAERGARRVWGRVAEDFPELSEAKGKPKIRRD
jgi:hypothetical protein